jgi:2-amino-1-hydroxyethylphosphonate dioxygenase (glycine-forming)
MISTVAIDEIRQLFEQHGKAAYYGEEVSQFQHAAQSGLLAEQQGFDKDTILAAFLHDIGHLLPSDQAVDHMEGYGRKNHELLAADWLLARGFSGKTAALIANHVNAKRYLVAKKEGYYEQLSEASKQTLEFQGGKMEEQEAARFEQDPLFDQYIQMRYWDEAAKALDMTTPDLDYFLEMMRSE